MVLNGYISKENIDKMNEEITRVGFKWNYGKHKRKRRYYEVITRVGFKFVKPIIIIVIINEVITVVGFKYGKESTNKN